MEIYNSETQTSYSENEFRALHPNISFPRTIPEDIIKSYGLHTVKNSIQPDPSSDLKKIIRDGVELVGVEYFMRWREINRFTSQEDENAFVTLKDNKADLSNDAIITYLRNHTLAEIETNIADDFSVIAGMTDAQIDTQVDAMSTITSMKPAIKALAKDMAAALKLLKITTKIAIYLIKKQL